MNLALFVAIDLATELTSSREAQEGRGMNSTFFAFVGSTIRKVMRLVGIGSHKHILSSGYILKSKDGVLNFTGMCRSCDEKSEVRLEN
jgi:hypothetical protein